jgi:hypothetical protein
VTAQTGRLRIYQSRSPSSHKLLSFKIGILLHDHLLPHGLQLLAEFVLHFLILFLELSPKIAHLLPDYQKFIRHIDELAIQDFVQVVIDQVHDHLRHLIDHLLSLDWQVILADRPRVFGCLFKGEGWQLGCLHSLTPAVLHQTTDLPDELLVLGDLFNQQIDLLGVGHSNYYK